MTIPASEIIEFGEWLPDLGEFNNEGAILIKNCISESRRYRPFNELSTFTDALPAECVGAFAYRDSAGNVIIFAGTKTNLYKLNGTSWDDVTRTSGGNYSTGDDGYWKFINYGELVIATNYTDDMQVFDVSSSTEFEQLAASAPRCRNMFILKNFLVCVNVVDGDGATSFRVRWSPLANPRGDWADVTLQADFQDIVGGDFANVDGVAIQDVGFIIQEKNIFRMEFVGGSDIFRFERVEDARGSIFNRGVTTDGRNLYYPGEDGFYLFNGVQSLPIGDGKVDKFFYDNVSEDFDFNLNVAVDPINKLILWAFPDRNSSMGVPNQIITYNWADNRWTIVEQDTQVLFQYLSTGLTLEELDTISTSIETLPFSLDSRNWTGGKTVFGAFFTDNKLGGFDGVPKTALVQTPDVRINPSGKAQLQSVIPYIEGGTVRGRLGHRELLSDDITWSAFTGLNSLTGELDLTKDVRFARVELELSGLWERAIGVSYRSQNTGTA